MVRVKLCKTTVNILNSKRWLSENGLKPNLAEFAEKMWLAENLPEKNTARRKSAEKVDQPAEYNKKIRLVGL